MDYITEIPFRCEDGWRATASQSMTPLDAAAGVSDGALELANGAAVFYLPEAPRAASIQLSRWPGTVAKVYCSNSSRARIKQMLSENFTTEFTESAVQVAAPLEMLSSGGMHPVVFTPIPDLFWDTPEAPRNAIAQLPLPVTAVLVLFYSETLDPGAAANGSVSIICA